MCGIVAYIGQRNAKQILLEGLRRLEYRGYDSAGIALVVDRVHVFKKQGKVAALEALIGDDKTESTIGIGHTRWATHGEPNDVNAHPHTSSAGKIALVHNGIIENYADLKREIESKGHVLVSETDTEVLTRYIEQVQRDLSCSLAEAVQTALRRVEGAYAIVLVSEAEPDTLIAARKGSPLVIGVGEGNKEFWLASDATPIVQYTRDVVYLDDEQVVVLTRSGMRITDLHDNTQEFTVKRLDMELSSIEKGGYAHFMLKEVMEQPHALADCLRGRVCAKTGHIGLGGIKKTLPALLSAKRLIFVACGTSRHAALVGEYLIEGLARVPVEVEFASEFRYRDPVLGPDDVVIAISQSGETADTLAAMQVAKDKGATVLAICNVVGSSVSRLSEEGCYTQAGPEIGVASTKAFTTQLAVLTVLALMLAKHKQTVSPSRLAALVADLEAVPRLMQEALLVDEEAKRIAAQFTEASSCLYLGRGTGFPVALEGALKLKEIAYVDANGYAAGELKHGPIALIVPGLPVVVVATEGPQNDKLASNVQEVRARGGRVLAVVTKGDDRMRGLADEVLEVPAVDPLLAPMLSVVPLQLLSYHIALSRGCDVDQPRNLAKSVTVE